jgi:hypothetical protein
MSSVADILEALGNITWGVADHRRTTAFVRATDIEPFLEALGAAVHHEGGGPCGENQLCLGGAVLVHDVQPLLSPDRQGLAEEVRRQIEAAHGMTIERIERRHEYVLSLACTTSEGWVEVRVLAHRGWILVISASDEGAARQLADVLDDEIDRVERRASS